MPGTNDDKCSFADCQYQFSGFEVWLNAGFTTANMHSDDEAQWGWELINETAFNIWDKQPL
ncbi:MAG: hypothetical protein HRF43_08460 [Phycisphaerae bacterium]|jgi:hypothetical protein